MPIVSPPVSSASMTFRQIVGGEVVDLHGALADRGAVGLVAHVETEALGARDTEIPVVERLLVDSPDAREPFVPEVPHEITADEASGTRDDDQVVPVDGRVLLDEPLPIHGWLSSRRVAIVCSTQSSKLPPLNRIPGMPAAAAALMSFSVSPIMTERARS